MPKQSIENFQVQINQNTTIKNAEPESEKEEILNHVSTLVGNVNFKLEELEGKVTNQKENFQKQIQTFGEAFKMKIDKLPLARMHCRTTKPIYQGYQGFAVNPKSDGYYLIGENQKQINIYSQEQRKNIGIFKTKGEVYCMKFFNQVNEQNEQNVTTRYLAIGGCNENSKQGFLQIFDLDKKELIFGKKLE